MRKNVFITITGVLPRFAWIVILCSLCLSAELVIEHDAASTSIPTRLINNTAYVSLPRVASVLGYSWEWDENADTFTGRRGSDTVSCMVDRNFFSKNATIMQLPCAPVRYRGTILIAAQQTSMVFSAPSGHKLHFTQEQGTFFLKDDKKEVQSPKLHPLSVDVPVGNVWGDKGIRTIVLDPGHGGKDPGAIGVGGVMEKDLVLGISLILRDELEKKKFTVHMTRDSDKFLSLKERTALANKKKADLFISVHADAIPGNRKKKESIKGFKIYFLSDAKSEEDRLVAMRENAVIELEENNQSQDYLHNILTEMVSTEHQIESQDLSIMIAESFGRSLSETRKLHRGIGQARFYVLNGAFMPAVLVETGFVSNSTEAKLLSTKKYQKKMADALFTAILDFKKKYEIGL